MATNFAPQLDCTPQSATVSVFNNALLHREILTYLSVATLYRLSFTCRFNYDMVCHYMLHVFDINHHLRDYFANPLSFRELQARTGLIISGSFAVQFLHRVTYPSSDLDLYVVTSSLVECGTYMLTEGYAFMPSPSQPATFLHAAVAAWHNQTEYNNMAVTGVFNFRKGPSLTTNTSRCIQVIAVVYTPIHAILRFHSSKWTQPSQF